MIIDAHAHIFPEKIAEKAAAGISGFYDNMPVAYNGMLKTLLAEGEAAGVSRFVVQSVATVPEQVPSINSFIAASVCAYPDKLIGFGALHPDYPDIAGETERIISLGLKGIKLHSDFQRFNIDDERAFPIYEAAEGRLPPSSEGKSLPSFSPKPKLLRYCNHFSNASSMEEYLLFLSRFTKT